MTKLGEVLIGMDNLIDATEKKRRRMKIDPDVASARAKKAWLSRKRKKQDPSSDKPSSTVKDTTVKDADDFPALTQKGSKTTLVGKILKGGQINKDLAEWSKIGDWEIRKGRGSDELRDKYRKFKNSVNVQIRKLNEGRDLVKDGHFIIEEESDYSKGKRTTTNVIKLTKPYSLQYEEAPKEDGMYSEWQPYDYEVDGYMIKIGDVVRFTDGYSDLNGEDTRHNTDVLIMSMNYSGDEWEGPSVDGYVVNSTGELGEHPLYMQKGHGDHRISDIRSVVSTSDIKMEGRR